MRNRWGGLLNPWGQ